MPPQANKPLPDGYQLNNYRIIKVLSCGGFSIVYLGSDEHGQPVAIKEYLPGRLALRGEGETQPSISSENLATFRYGMRCFFEEGRSLARLSHPNIVRVLDFFRANETVYIVMRYECGRTLQDHIRQRFGLGSLRENFLRNIFTRLLNGLREVHSGRMVHLDIKPANIYIRNDGVPVLLDFGGARQTIIANIVNGRPALRPLHTPGFAPPEQYRDRDLLGPWSDIYSVGATLFSCLAGIAPQSADSRVALDRYVPATRLWAGKYSRHLLKTIDWCLELDHLRRPQSVFVLQKALLRERVPDAHGGMSFVENLRGRVMRLAGR